MQKYIHYGSSSLREIDPVKNDRLFTKPIGGLWASRKDAKFGWKDWCLRENFCTGSLNKSFEFFIKDDARILHLYNTMQLEELPKIETEFSHSSRWITLDFEKLAKSYDGIELHLSEEETEDMFNGLYWKLYGWDCDSILIFNKDIIVI